jgi:hypothetical protein
MPRRWRWLWAIILVGCGRAASPGDAALEEATTMTLTIRSEAFAAQQPIPKKHTGDGEDVSPSLSWSGAPTGVAEWALIVDDPDAPTPEPWVHWVLFKIPASASGLEEGAIPPGALEGKNSWGTLGYRGPAPPKGHGVHHYHFKVYALREPITLGAGADKASLIKAMQGKTLAQGEVIGAYRR